MSDTMKVTIIVSNSDPVHSMPACLHAACNQSVAAEVILSNPSPCTPEDRVHLDMLKHYYPHFHILEEGGNRAERINEAVRMSKGDLLLFIESHCLVDKDWVKRWIQRFEHKISVGLGEIEALPTNSYASKGETYIFKKTRKKVRNVPHYLDFHNTAIRRDTFEKLGGVDPHLPMMGEFDLGARMCEENITIHRFEDNVLHCNEDTIPGYIASIKKQGHCRVRIYRLRGKQFFERYFPTPRLVKYMPLLRTFNALARAAVNLQLLFNKSIFYFGESIHSKTLAMRGFSSIARCANRLGQLSGVRET